MNKDNREPIDEVSRSAPETTDHNKLKPSFKALLTEYLKVQHLTVGDNEPNDILKLYQTNESYAKVSNHYPVTMEHVIRDIEERPPATDRSQKHYLSIYDQSEQLIAVIDVIECFSYQGLNKEKTSWIGLLEVDQSRHQTGIGRKLTHAIEWVCIQRGQTDLQLGVIRDNQAALKFWTNVGFEVFEEKKTDEYDLVLMKKNLSK